MIRLSKKAEYALRALCAMARERTSKPFQVQELAAKQNIPAKFLEQILLALKRGGVLDSKRGVGGGYRLQRPPDRISLGEVVTIMDGPDDAPDCAAPAATCLCRVPGGCGMGSFFHDLQRDTDDRLQNTSLTDLLNRERRPEDMNFEI